MRRAAMVLVMMGLATASVRVALAAGAGEVTENSIGMKLVMIPAGEFTMGSDERPDESPAHRVRITRPFLLGQTEVTQGQWERVMGTTPWRGRSEVKEGRDVAASYVSWAEAAEFCDRLTEIERKAGKLPEGRSYRLPTESEWEYACRAGTTTRFSFGDDGSLMGDHAWYDGNSRLGEGEFAHEVGRKRPNPWSLCDMHGNVYEWCSDWYHKNSYEEFSGKVKPAVDPRGLRNGTVHVLRGGSWRLDPVDCRSADRSLLTSPTGAGASTGLRVACDAE